MSAAEVEWEPGDPNPYAPDQGTSGFANVFMREDERAAILAADTGTPPPWWRPPAEEGASPGDYTRSCATCGVRWRGDEPCWVCGGEQLP
ncbi:hypothetical protein [Nocardioides sp.]|uniref:hypothetical protein n=1 Tax=Nocardioides sp. TaxID=35761 RepID=UPI0035B4CA51